MFWRPLAAWLQRVPIEDPVDRRNAPLVQLLLIGMGCFVPFNKVLLLSSDVFLASMTNLGLTVDLATDVLMTAAAWISFWHVRRGRFRHGVVLYLSMLLVAAAVAYAAIGLQRLSNDPLPLLFLGIGGLLLGRRALWTIYAALMAVFAIGLAADLVRGVSPGAGRPFFASAMSLVESYLIVAFILDRTMTALRGSLAESNARGRRLEQEMIRRERAQLQLVHAQKMEAVGRIASGLAHDFDNLLNVVLGYAMRRERLADRGAPALLDALGGVELAARRALAVSRKLLNFSRQDEARPQTFDAAAALDELRPMLRQMFDAQVRLAIDIDERELFVHLDRGQFELMVLNIAANARDAMPEGGRFSISARRDAQTSAELLLADSGCGMSEEVRRQVFEPFYTTKPLGSGTGLGLAVVRDLVLAAGGSIAVESVPGQGTVFRIYLPLALTAAGTLSGC